MYFTRLVSLSLLAIAACLPLGALAQTDRDWFVFLETGRKTPEDKAAVTAMQRGHIANFEKLFAQGRLFAAGPLRDPKGIKRGIVVVRAATLEDLVQMFQPDDYVREGYMTLNAAPAIVHKALHTEGIDVKKMEEVRILQISRPAGTPDAASIERSRAFLRTLLAQGKVGAWYAPQSGPVADILFINSTDNAHIEQLFSAHPDIAGGTSTLAVWGQWLAHGVVR